MSVSADDLKAVMSRVAATVTVVTANGDEGPVGLTMTAVLSISADPPIVLISIDKSASSLQPMLNAEGFTINVMPEGTEDEVMLFATRGADKFGGTRWVPPTTPVAGPVLENSFASMECAKVETIEMGDHWVIFGSVEAIDLIHPEATPLVWLGRGFAKVE